MKNILTKVFTSMLALALVAASATVAKAPVKEIEKEETKTPAVVETVEKKEEAKEEAKTETGILAAVEAKIKENTEVVYEEEAVPAAEEIEVPAAEEIKVPAAEIKDAAPIAKVKAEAETPVEEIPEEPAEEPVMVWDISATEFDNVAMAFYAVPVTANQVSVDRTTGIAHISGVGAMEESVYTHFMSVEKFLTAVKAAFEETYGVEVDLVYDEDITDVIELDRTITYFNHETGEELFVTEEMRMNLDPAEFVEYSPTKIVIDEGITNISNYAFVMCDGLTEVVLPSTVEEIGDCAFEYCGSLRKIVIPENAKINIGAFGYCHNLQVVALASDEYYYYYNLNAMENYSLEGQSGGTSGDEYDMYLTHLSAEEVTALKYM